MKAIFLALLLVALGFAGVLQDFDKSYYYADKSQRLLIHQQLKSLYVRSIIQDDNKLKEQILRRLLISSKALNLNPKDYEAELKSMGKSTAGLTLASIKPKAKTTEASGDKKHTKPKKASGENSHTKPSHDQASGDKKLAKPNEASVNISQMMSLLDLDKIIKSSNPAKPNPIKSPEALKDNASAKQSDKAKTTTPEALKDKSSQACKFAHAIKIAQYNSEDNVGVKISFNSKPCNLVQHNYLNMAILSLEAALDTGKKSFEIGTYNFKILQYNPKTMRINISAKSLPQLTYKVENNELYVFVQNDKLALKNPTKAPNKTPKARNFKNKLLITIDAGHGGKDSGALGHNHQEKTITLAIALKLDKILRARGYKTFLTRNKDVFIGLRERTRLANVKKSDLFISIHANSLADKHKADKVHGIETYFLSPARSERSKNAAAAENKSDIEEMNYFSKQTFLNFLNREKIIASNKLAIDIQAGILSNLPKQLHVRDGGVKEAPFWVLVGALMPAVLIETGYITNKDESNNLASGAYQDKLATGIANGIESYFRKNKFFD